MVRSIRSLFVPPRFADEERTRVAAVLHTLLLAVLAGLGAIVVFSLVLPGISARSLIVVGPLCFVTLALLVVLRRGYVRLASLVSSLSCWAAVTVACALAGGVRAPAFSAYLIVVLISGLLLGWRAALGFAALSLVSELALLYATNADRLPAPFYENTPITITIFQIIALLCGTVLLGVMRHRAEAALHESEERYARLSDAAFEGIGFCEDDILFDANIRLAEMLGYTLDELIGMPTEQLVAPESRDLVRRRVQAGYQEIYEHLALHKDGSVFPVEVRSRAMQHQGRPIRVTVVRDISERVAAQQALIASELRFRVLFHGSPAPQILTNAADGTILDVNMAYERLMGYRRDDLVGKRTTELPIWVGLDRVQLTAALHAQGRLTDWPTQMRTQAGTVRDLLLSMEPVQVGETPCLLCVIIDLTEQMAAQRALYRSERMFSELVQSINAAADLEAALRVALEQVCAATGWVLGQAWLPRADGRALECSTAWFSQHDGLDGFRQATESLTLPLGVGLPGRVWQTKMAAWVQDVTADANFPRTAAAQAAGLKAGMAFPVLADDAVVAVLEFFVVDVRPEDARLIALVSTVAAQLGAVVVRKRAEAALAESEARFRAIFERAAIGVALVDMDGQPIAANPALEAMLGYTTDDLRAMPFATFTHPDDVDTDLALFGELIAGAREFYQLTKRYIHKDGQIVWGNLRMSLVRDKAGAPQFAIGTVEDITDQRRIEQQYLQVQKMDSIGRLAGGIAHDFNNLLTIILGNTDMVLEELGESHALGYDMAQIRQAADRAAALTRQLLAFSRKQAMTPHVIDLNDVVMGIAPLIRRLIGEHIQLVLHLTDDMGHVLADPGQLEQVIMNLAINARDAMEGGGTLTIETANAMLEDPPPGSYMLLAVSDTGIGMDDATKERIFEPFFTTKAEGKGTGLGLATVYGIVTQSGGHVWVYSELGRGTTFKVYLPRTDAPEDDGGGLTAAIGDDVGAGGATVLLVEDDAAVRDLARRALEERGYVVVEAADGQSALDLVDAYAGPIHLLLTDVIMPGGLNGAQLAEGLRAILPDLRVLYMSGYTDGALSSQAVFASSQTLLIKPFTPRMLARAVRAALQPLDTEPPALQARAAGA
jgi:two-component system, cell cycle sensor histidine kinase and response regulator CckA